MNRAAKHLAGPIGLCILMSVIAVVLGEHIYFPSGAIAIICVGNFSSFCVFSTVIMFKAVIRTPCDDSLPSGDTELLLVPDERTAQKKVSSLFLLGRGTSSFFSHSIIYLCSFTPAKKQIKQKGDKRGR